MTLKLYFILLLICSSFCLLGGTLSKSGKENKKKPTKDKPKKNKETGLSSSDAGLTYSEILQNHERVDFSEEKKFPGEVLGYVTPWNNHGYDVAKFLAQKFSLISPVWFQIIPTDPEDPNSARCTISGTHDMDQGWIKDVRKNNSNVKIVPRFFLENWSGSQLRRLFAYEEEQSKCAQTVVDFIKRNRFQGAVLELWVHVMSMSQGMASMELIQLVINWGEIFANNDLISILPVPPPLNAQGDGETGLFTYEHYEEMVPYLDFINIMTYDYPNRRPGPVAPIDWVMKNVEWLIFKQPEFKEKILMGLNFYGYDYAPMSSKIEAVVGKKFLEIISKHKPEILWDREGAEHFIEYNQHILYYPSLVSIEARLNLAKELGVGVAIWDSGQGLDYFYNLF